MPDFFCRAVPGGGDHEPTEGELREAQRVLNSALQFTGKDGSWHAYVFAWGARWGRIVCVLGLAEVEEDLRVHYGDVTGQLDGLRRGAIATQNLLNAEVAARQQLPVLRAHVAELEREVEGLEAAKAELTRSRNSLASQLRRAELEVEQLQDQLRTVDLTGHND